MKIFGFSLLLLTFLEAQAQQSVIRGEVSIINSEYENKVRLYVSNAQVEEDFGRSQATTTDAAGQFRLNIVGIKEKESITFTAKKKGLEVVNIDALNAVAGQNEIVKVYMAAPQKIAEYKRQYYQVGKTSAEKTLDEKLKKLQTERQNLLSDKKADKQRIEGLEAQLGLLEAQRAKIEADARELARRYAPVNLDDASPLYREAFSWFQKGELIKSLDVLSQADLAGQAKDILKERAMIKVTAWELALRDSLQKQRTAEVLSALGLKADLHKSRFEWDSTEICFEIMLDLDSTNFNNLFNFAYFLAEQNQQQRAIQVYEKALTIAQTDIQRSDLLNNLGNLYRANQKTRKAKEAYYEALTIRRRLADTNPNAFLPGVVTTQNSLGAFHSEVEQGYHMRLKIRLEMSKTPDAFLSHLSATPLSHFRPYYHSQKIPEAQQAYSDALLTSRRLADKNPDVFLPDLAATLNNLGNYHSDNQEIGAAENVYNEALNIRRKLAGRNPDVFLPDLANTLNSLGVFYTDNHKMPEAKKAYDEALGIRRKLADKNPDAFLPLVANTLNNLGNYHSENQNMQEAEKSYNEALDIRRKLADKNPHAFLPFVANTLNNLGNYHSENQNMQEAEKSYNEALEIRRKLADKNPDVFLPDVAQTSYNLGLFFKKSGNYSRALSHFEECLSINQAEVLRGQVRFYKNWIDAWAELYQMQDILTNQRQYALACRAYLSVATTFDKLAHKEFTMWEYGGLSRWALFARDYPLAERAALRCLALDPEQIFVYANIGHSLLLRGYLVKVKETYSALKGKKDGNGKDYKIVLEEDFQALEAAGITHKGLEEIRRWLREEW